MKRHFENSDVVQILELWHENGWQRFRVDRGQSGVLLCVHTQLRQLYNSILQTAGKRAGLDQDDERIVFTMIFVFSVRTLPEGAIEKRRSAKKFGERTLIVPYTRRVFGKRLLTLFSLLPVTPIFTIQKSLDFGFKNTRHERSLTKYIGYFVY